MSDPVTLIDVDPDSPVAPYEQLRARIAELARAGLADRAPPAPAPPAALTTGPAPGPPTARR